MNWKLLFIFCLAVALLVEVDGASRDKKKKKDRRNDNDEEDTTGGSLMGDEDKAKKEDNKDGGREREREGKEKKEKKSSESSEEDEEKKNATEVEIPKRSRRQLKKSVELNEVRKKSSESSEECCDDKLKKASEVNGGVKIELAKKPVMETSSRVKRGHHIEARKGLDLVPHKKDFQATDLLQGLPTAVSEAESESHPPIIKIEDLIRKKRDHHEGHAEMPKSQTHARQGLAAGEQQQGQQQGEAPPKSQTHARQGHAANQENQKREKRDHHEGHPELIPPVAHSHIPPVATSETQKREKRDHHEGHDQPPKSQTHARQGLAAGEQQQGQQQGQAPPKSQTHARQGHAANQENHKREQRDANEEVPDETYGDPISTTTSPEGESEKREKRDSDEIGPKVASTPMSLNNPANPEGGAVFTEIINSPQMRKRRQLITENGQLYNAEVHPTEEQPILEELINPAKRVERMKRERELKREAEVNDGQKLNLNQHAKAHTHARQGHAANPDNHQH